MVGTLRCRRCERELAPSDCVWLTAENEKSSKPACRECYFEEVTEEGEKEAEKEAARREHRGQSDQDRALQEWDERIRRSARSSQADETVTGDFGYLEQFGEDD